MINDYIDPTLYFKTTGGSSGQSSSVPARGGTFSGRSANPISYAREGVVDNEKNKKNKRRTHGKEAKKEDRILLSDARRDCERRDIPRTGGEAPVINSLIGGGKEKDKKKKKSGVSKLRKELKIKKNELTVIQNADKKLHEKWGDKNHPKNLEDPALDLFNFPKPFRCLISGVPNSGKTTCIKNMLCHMNPEPAQIFLLHQELFNPHMEVLVEEEYDPKDFEESKKKVDEYDDIDDLILLKTVPNTKYFEDKGCKKKHSVLILDDVALKEWSRHPSSNNDILNKLFSFISTHFNLTILASFQDIYSQATPACYRFANMFVLFKPSDLKSTSQIAGNVGLKPIELKSLVSLCKNSHDCVVLDNTNDTPAQRRINFSTVIEME